MMQPLYRLRRFLDPRLPYARGSESTVFSTRSRDRKGAVCELCGAPFDGRHAHVIDLESRRLMCTCRPCYLLFTHPGAAGGRYRSVSERVMKLSEAADSSWESLGIPVGIAFFLRNSARGRVLAFYPSPAGATESTLPLEAWDEIVAALPVLATLEPDVEALLVCRRRERMESWIVPVDACYELVGRLRRSWKGFEGGAEAWSEIDAFFAGLEERERSCA